MLDFIPVFIAGLSDSVNPCAFTTIIFFIILLSILGTTEKRVRVCGFIFIATIFFVTLGLIIGVFDFVLGPLKIQLFLRYSQLWVAALLVGLGIANLCDWIIYSKNRDTQRLLIKIPAFLGPPDAGIFPHQKITKKSIIVSIAAGSGAAVLGSAWPPHYALASAYYGLLLPGQWLSSLTAFIVYTIVFVLPLICVLGGILFIMNSEKLTARLRSCVSKIKIVSAAILISLGIGLFQIFS